MSISEHVMVGLSGGVDSAVAAWRLKEQGYRVSGLFMQNWTEDEQAYCTAAEDYQSARAVAEELDIPLHKADFSEAYRERVFQHFLEDYRSGKTPNPDLLCNREVKFQPFREHALRLGADWVATGHYARVEHEDPAGPQLLRSVTEDKDQTYFLALVAREHFEKVQFPIGDLGKPEVRKFAQLAGLPNHQRKDSTGICFIGERPFRDFLERYLKPNPGEIVDDQGAVLGKHQGLMYHTLGQRRGLHIGGVKGAKEAPWYVVAKRAEKNQLVISQQAEHPLLMSRSVSLSNFSWLAPPPESGKTLSARIRHRQKLQGCKITAQADTKASGGRVEIRFEHLQRAATPGQYCVLYDGLRCLGGGEIETAVGDTP